MNELQKKLARRKLLNGEGKAANNVTEEISIKGDLKAIESSDTMQDSNRSDEVGGGSVTTDELSQKLARRRSWENDQSKNTGSSIDAEQLQKKKFGEKDIPFNAAALHAQNENADEDEDEPDFVDIQNEKSSNNPPPLVLEKDKKTVSNQKEEVPQWLAEAEEDVEWKSPSNTSTVTNMTEEPNTVPFVSVPSTDEKSHSADSVDGKEIETVAARESDNLASSLQQDPDALLSAVKGPHTAADSSSIADITEQLSIEDVPVWEPSPEVAVKLERWFALLDTDGTGRVGGEDIVKFLVRSQLNWETLRSIWAIVDTKNIGSVDFNGFKIIMRLVSICCCDNFREEFPSLNLYKATVDNDIPLPVSMDRTSFARKRQTEIRLKATDNTQVSAVTDKGDEGIPQSGNGSNKSPAVSNLKLEMNSAAALNYFKEFLEEGDDAVVDAVPLSASKSRTTTLEDLNNLLGMPFPSNAKKDSMPLAPDAELASDLDQLCEIDQLRSENQILKLKLKELSAELQYKQNIIDAYELAYPSRGVASQEKVPVLTANERPSLASLSNRPRSIRHRAYYSGGITSAMYEDEDGGALFDEIDSNPGSNANIERASDTEAAIKYLSEGSSMPGDNDLDELINDLSGGPNNSENDSNSKFGLLDVPTSSQRGAAPLELSSSNFTARSFGGAQRNGLDDFDDEEAIANDRAEQMKAILDSHGLFGENGNSLPQSEIDQMNSRNEALNRVADDSAGLPEHINTRVGIADNDDDAVSPLSKAKARSNLFGDEQNKKSNPNSNSESSKKAMDYQEFLYRFTRCLNLVDLTRNFLFSILGPNGDTSAPPKGKKINYIFYGLYKLDERCKGFFDQMQQMIEDHQEFKGEDEERLLCARDGLEQYIMCRIADYAFDICLTPDEDYMLLQRMRVLSFLTPESMYIKKEHFNETLLTLAGDELRRINAFKTPGDKVACVVKSAAIIFRSLSLCSKRSNNNDDDENNDDENKKKVDSTPAGADDFLPLFIWVVMQSYINNLCSNCSYIEAYLNPARLIGKSGYCLINLRSAIEFVLYSDASQINMNEEEFNSKLAIAMSKI